MSSLGSKHLSNMPSSSNTRATKSPIRYVAYFDFIGFRNWIRTEGSAEVYSRVVHFLGLAMKGSLPNSTVGEEPYSMQLRRSRVTHFNFSDTIIFYTTTCSYASLRELIKTCVNFMVLAVEIQMVRGAIAKGYFRVFREDRIHIGEALLDAHDLAESQDWVGISLHSSMEDDPHFLRYQKDYPRCLVRYPAPLKHGVHGGYCLNWLDKRVQDWDFFPADSLEECRKRALASAAGHPEEIKKIDKRIEHTRAFLIKHEPEEMRQTMGGLELGFVLYEKSSCVLN